VKFENLAEPFQKQPKQPSKMAKASEEPVIETMKDFLIAYAGYSEVDADNPEALQGALTLLSRNGVGLKDILAITDRDYDKIVCQLGSILPDAKPVELARMARGLRTWRGEGPTGSSGSGDAADGSISSVASRARLPQAARGRMEAHVMAYNTTLDVHDYSTALTYTVEKLAQYNPVGTTDPNQRNILARVSCPRTFSLTLRIRV